MRSRTGWRLQRMLVIALLVFGATQVPGSADEGPQPGLPEHTESPGGWTAIIQTGLAETAKARQWARVPPQLTAAYTHNVTTSPPPPDPRYLVIDSTNFVYLVAPKGAPHTYGISSPFTVRTVAFGSVPVAATVRIEQRRDRAGMPLPIVATTRQDVYPPPPGKNRSGDIHDTRIDDALVVRVLGLRVDGTDLGLTGACRTAAGRLSLLGKGYYSEDIATDMPSGHYAAGAGGLLTGTIDIPAFAGCLTSTGEDVSRLLTAAVSGPGNEVSLNVSPPTECGPERPPAPGSSDPRAVCPERPMPPDFAIPKRAR